MRLGGSFSFHADGDKWARPAVTPYHFKVVEDLGAEGLPGVVGIIGIEDSGLEHAGGALVAEEGVLQALGAVFFTVSSRSVALDQGASFASSRARIMTACERLAPADSRPWMS